MHCKSCKIKGYKAFACRLWRQQRGRKHLEAAGRVVDAGVDDLAVAGTGASTEAWGGLDHEYLAPGHRQRARHREADDSRADYHGVRRLPWDLGGQASVAPAAPQAADHGQAPQREHAGALVDARLPGGVEVVSPAALGAGSTRALFVLTADARLLFLGLDR